MKINNQQSEFKNFKTLDLSIIIPFWFVFLLSVIILLCFNSYIKIFYNMGIEDFHYFFTQVNSGSFYKAYYILYNTFYRTKKTNLLNIAIFVKKFCTIVWKH